MEEIVEGIILAAGLSKRMGLSKTLIAIEGDTLIGRVMTAALEAGLHRVVLVTNSSNFKAARTVAASAGSRLSIVVNPRPDEGMSSSIKSGLADLSPDAAGVMILLGDQPGVTAGTINRLLSTFRSDMGKIVVPTVYGRRTTPVIFPAILFPELMTATGDVGGREVLKRNPDKVSQVEMGSAYDDTDLDTPEDLDRFLRRSNHDKASH
jgi:molybdenum cofactor cytidylyltransferase